MKSWSRTGQRAVLGGVCEDRNTVHGGLKLLFGKGNEPKHEKRHNNLSPFHKKNLQHHFRECMDVKSFSLILVILWCIIYWAWWVDYDQFFSIHPVRLLFKSHRKIRWLVTWRKPGHGAAGELSGFFHRWIVRFFEDFFTWMGSFEKRISVKKSMVWKEPDMDVSKNRGTPQIIPV